MLPTVIALWWVEGSLSTLITEFLMEKSLEFPQLGGVVLQLFCKTRICLSKSCHNTSVCCGCCCQIWECSNGVFGHLIFIVSDGGVFWVVTGCGCRFSLQLFVFTVSSGKMRFEVCTSFSTVTFSFHQRHALIKWPLQRFLHTQRWSVGGDLWGRPLLPNSQHNHGFAWTGTQLAVGDPRLGELGSPFRRSTARVDSQHSRHDTGRL
jgi:hypothetical protein